MADRAEELIRQLDLVEHPEGGFYREVFRSVQGVTTDVGSRRAALTSIYYLLPESAHSAWHAVASDESWHFQEGFPLELLVIDPIAETLIRPRVGPVSGTQEPTHVVPAKHWQSARSLGEYTLVSCTVGPGFDFQDFILLRDDPYAATRIREEFSDLAFML